MEARYSHLYNNLSEFNSHYVTFKEKNRHLRYMLPVSYYWLKHYGLEKKASLYAREMDNQVFSIIHDQLIEVHEQQAADTYGKYYDLLDISDKRFKENIDYLGSFLEHYCYNQEIENETERIIKSLHSRHVTMPAYLEVTGPFIFELTKREKKIKKEDYLKVAFTKELQDLEPFLVVED